MNKTLPALRGAALEHDCDDTEMEPILQDLCKKISKHFCKVVGELNVDAVCNADKSITVVFYNGTVWDWGHALSGSAEAWELFLKLAGEEEAKTKA